MSHFFFPSSVTPELTEQEDSKRHSSVQLECGGHYQNLSLKTEAHTSFRRQLQIRCVLISLSLRPRAGHSCYILQLLYRAVLEMLCIDLPAAKFYYLPQQQDSPPWQRQWQAADAAALSDTHTAT